MIKNRTSSVAPEKSINQIEKTLIGMGARNIAKEYDGFGKVDSITFSISHPTMGGGVIPFKLPAKRGPLKKIFMQQYRRPTRLQEKSAEEQADRTAWKNIKEWVELQATMIKLEQVEFMEVFMPYVYVLDKGQTFYETLKDNGFKQLGM